MNTPQPLFFVVSLLLFVPALLPGQTSQSGNVSATVDFTDGSVPTFGQNAQAIRAGKFMLIAGDANSDGQVNAVDVNLVWRIQNGQPFLYLLSTGDYNLDGTVNAVDLNLFWRPNNSKASQVPIGN